MRKSYTEYRRGCDSDREDRYSRSLRYATLRALLKHHETNESTGTDSSARLVFVFLINKQRNFGFLFIVNCLIRVFTPLNYAVAFF